MLAKDLLETIETDYRSQSLRSSAKSWYSVTLDFYSRGTSTFIARIENWGAALREKGEEWTGEQASNLRTLRDRVGSFSPLPKARHPAAKFVCGVVQCVTILPN
jgi:transposase-like protein